MVLYLCVLIMFFKLQYMVLYLCVLIMFLLRRESLKLILVDDPSLRWFCHKSYCTPSHAKPLARDWLRPGP
jgi:hypothetical protein